MQLELNISVMKRKPVHAGIQKIRDLRKFLALQIQKEKEKKFNYNPIS
jgi:hypothetical protein